MARQPKPKPGTPATPGATQFAQESAAQSTAPSQAMVALFAASPTAEQALAKLERRNLPQLVKPDDVPMNGILSGVIVKIVDSPVSTIKGKLLWLRHASGAEFMFPCAGSIRAALAPGSTNDDADLSKKLEKEIGKTLYAKRCPDKVTKKYDKEGKRMFVFDVYTSDK